MSLPRRQDWGYIPIRSALIEQTNSRGGGNAFREFDDRFAHRSRPYVVTVGSAAVKSPLAMNAPASEETPYRPELVVGNFKTYMTEQHLRASIEDPCWRHEPPVFPSLTLFRSIDDLQDGDLVAVGNRSPVRGENHVS